MWPAFSHSRSVEPGIRSCSLRLWLMEVSRSAVPQMMVVGTRPSDLDGVELVEPLEAREELRDHLERRVARASGPRSRRTPPAPRRRTRTGRSRPSRTERPARRTPSTSAVPAGQGAHGAVGELAAELGGQHRQQDPARVEAAGGGGDQADADDAVAEQLGVLLGEGNDRHAAHGVTDEDDRPLRDDVLEDRLEVAAELVDRGVVLGRAAGAAVRALVVVDRADQPAVGRALEVPAVEVERVAVAEDDRERARRLAQRRGRARRPRRGGARRRRRRSVTGRECRLPNGVASSLRRPIARLCRRTPIAAPAAATPTAPARGPEDACGERSWRRSSRVSVT